MSSTKLARSTKLKGISPIWTNLYTNYTVLKQHLFWWIIYNYNYHLLYKFIIFLFLYEFFSILNDIYEFHNKNVVGLLTIFKLRIQRLLSVLVFFIYFFPPFGWPAGRGEPIQMSEMTFWVRFITRVWEEIVQVIHWVYHY